MKKKANGSILPSWFVHALSNIFASIVEMFSLIYEVAKWVLRFIMLIWVAKVPTQIDRKQLKKEV